MGSSPWSSQVGVRTPHRPNAASRLGSKRRRVSAIASAHMGPDTSNLCRPVSTHAQNWSRLIRSSVAGVVALVAIPALFATQLVPGLARFERAELVAGRVERAELVSDPPGRRVYHRPLVHVRYRWG